MPLAATLIGRPAEAKNAAGEPDRNTPKIRIPAAALTNLDGKPAVWTLEPGGGAFVVRARFVTVGGYTKDSVIITAGLAPGDRVAAAGAQILREGQKVREMRHDGP